MNAQEVIDRVRKPILKTWSYIADDSGAQSNEDAMELCIDAGRIVMETGDKEANDMIGKLCNDLGYSTAIKLLSDNIRLI